MNQLFLFANSQQPGWHDCYSMTNKGDALGNHICSNSNFMKYDLHDREDRLEKIKEYFNNEPYELIIVPDNEVKTHEGLLAAYKLNQEKAKEIN